MTATHRDPMLARLERDSMATAGVMMVLAALLWPGQPQRALGVLGGFALLAVSYQGIRAGVEGLWAVPPASTGRSDDGPAPPRQGPRAGFVKFFTRHAILAAGAYVMMARFEFDPMAMLAGVTAPAVAATLELVRTFRARQGGPHSRSS